MSAEVRHAPRPPAPATDRGAPGVAARPGWVGRRRADAGPAVAVLGLAALAARRPGWGAVAVTAAVGAAALVPAVDLHRATRGPAGGAARAGTWAAAVAIGTAAMAATRLAGPVLPLVAHPGAMAASAGAAIAEEALFRRLLYDRLARWGPAVAVVGSAVAFASVHVPLYGLRAVPLNLAAAVLLGWQRWATGGWSAPAATHLAANLLAYA